MLVMIITGLMCCIPICLFARVDQQACEQDYFNAAKCGDTSRLACYLAAGVDRNLTDKDGNTVLELARKHDQFHVVAWLNNNT